MKKKGNRDSFFEELSLLKPETKELLLFDQTDKPFLILYLFIFILGIILTVLSI